MCKGICHGAVILPLKSAPQLNLRVATPYADQSTAGLKVVLESLASYHYCSWNA